MSSPLSQTLANLGSSIMSRSLLSRLCMTLAMTWVLAGSGVAAADQAPIDTELEKYWNVELAVPTLDNPLFARKGAFELVLGTGVVPNDSYYLPLPISVRAGYHFTESLAIDLAFSYLVTPKSELLTFLEEPVPGQRSLLEGVVKPPRMGMLLGLDLVYSPFHGKLGVFDKKLSSFDVGLVLGAGAIMADVDETEEEDAMQSRLLPAARWGVTMRFFLNRWLHVRADVRQFLYKPEASLLFPVELTLGVALLSI